MSLERMIPELVDHLDSEMGYLKHNKELFRIYEGELLPFIEQDLKQQIPHSFDMFKGRIPPINVMVKLVDKLSNIYQQNPKRIVNDGTEQDVRLLEWYDHYMHVDAIMNGSNEFYNMYKSSLVQPYLHQGVPRLRAIPNYRFLVFSNDPIDPLNMTHLVIISEMESQKGIYNKYKLWIWSDDEFMLVEKGQGKPKILRNEMEMYDNAEGVNPFGKIPYIYINGSKNLLQPLADTDLKRMTKLIPVLLSDLNYAVMFQAFSIIYGIDLDDQDLTMAPNAFWKFKSDETVDKQPQIGSIKPQVDIDQVIKLIETQMTFWLNTRGIRADAIGSMSGADQSSGISKIINEMDTSELRQKQVTVYKKAESELWDLIMHYMHPVWVTGNLIQNNAMYSPNASVSVQFPVQLPMISKNEILQDIKLQREIGTMSALDAIMAANPELTEEKAKAKLIEISSENDLRIALDGVAESTNTST